MKRQKKKLLLTFGDKGLWFESKIGGEIKSYNVPIPYDVMTHNWWEGLIAFAEQKEKIAPALRYVDKIFILSEVFSGFFAGFIINFLQYAKSRGKEIVIITSENPLCDSDLVNYLSNTTKIINVMEDKSYQKDLESNLGVYGLENRLNSLYIDLIEKCLKI